MALKAFIGGQNCFALLSTGIRKSLVKHAPCAANVTLCDPSSRINESPFKFSLLFSQLCLWALYHIDAQDKRLWENITSGLTHIFY